VPVPHPEMTAKTSIIANPNLIKLLNPTS
jgi:hypothetical protein